MFASRSITRAIVCALLASAVVGVAPAAAKPAQEPGALAQERSYSSYGQPESIDAGIAAADAQERYYSSYDVPTPLGVSQAPQPSDDSPWFAITLSIAAALAIIAAGAILTRRLRVRRRAPRVTA